ncbi:MEDS domain-containing protein [Caballeronia grimmiae]|nr:MEDS domain-containing protein [Caballeronia grimmiae]
MLYETRRPSASRDTGVPAIGPAGWGTHFCQFYKKPADLLTILTPYFAAGLRNNEQCLWITTDANTVETSRRGLLDVAPELAEKVDAGQLDIRPAHEWYGGNSAFDGPRVVQQWLDYEKAALQRGFDGVRVTGDTAWLDSSRWSDFARYEESLNSSLANAKILCLCTYCLDRCTASDSLDIVEAHSLALVCRKGGWTAAQIMPLADARQAIDDAHDQRKSLSEATRLSGLISWELDAAGEDIVWTNATRAWTDSPPSIPLAGLHRYLRPLQAIQLEKAVRASEETGSPIDMSVTVALKRGRSLHLDVKGGRCYTGPNDTRKRVVGTIENVTRRREAELIRQQQEAEYRRLVEMLPVGVLIGRDNRVEYNNVHATSILGYQSARDVRALPLLAHIAQPARESIEMKFAALRAGRSIDPGFEPAQLIRADGSTIEVEAAVIPLRGQDGLRKQLVFRDMTDAVHMREQLQTANTSLKALSKRLIDVQETEKAALARELHDEVGQLLTAIKIHSQSLRNRVDGDLGERCDRLLTIADRALKEVRDLSAMLRPPQLDQLGLVAAVRWQLSTLFADHGPDVTLLSDEFASRPSPGIEMAAFRIVQESITNILRHAHATAALVEIRCYDGHLHVQITDDGEGFDPHALRSARSVGLTGMRERAMLAGGELDIVSKPSTGTQVSAVFPLMQ